MSAKRSDIQASDIQSLKLFKPLTGLLERLHEVGCQRDRASNRQLHMDQYMLLLILYMFNPICTSLRALQQASALKKVQKKLGVPRASLGSLSEARQVFDPALLVEVIRDLAGQLKPLVKDTRLQELGQILTIVDGTLLKALPKMAWALWVDDRHRGVKAHVQFEALTGVPVSAVITEGRGNEKTVLAEHLESGRLYVMDRGYAKYGLLEKILKADSSFVCRIYENAVFDVIEDRPLSTEAREAKIFRDVTVHLGSEANRDGLQSPVRLIQLHCTPHEKRNSGSGPAQGETMILATDRLDLPAEVIALIFRHRWAVEIFFRFFKHTLGCRHLLSHKKDGIELQTYAAILACLLIALWTNRKPSLRTYEMICYYLMGWAEEDELLAHIGKLQQQD